MRPTAGFALLLGLAATAHAQIVVDSVRFGYTGSVTRFATFADARAGTNALATSAVPQRDLRITILADAPWLYAGTSNINYVGTLWNFVSTADGRTPSNTNLGFVQLGDLDASTITALSASWNAGLDTFSLHLAGANATRADDYARLWNAGGQSGPAAITAGTFISYELNLVAGGLNAAWDAAHGSYDSFQQDPATLSGDFTGLFQNTSADDGYFYTFDLALNLTSWAFDHRGDLTSESQPYSAGTFATPTVIPEPSTIGALLGAAALGLAVCHRRRRLSPFSRDQ